MAKSSGEISPHPAFIAEQVRDYRYFFLNLVAAPKKNLTVACGGWERCAPNYRVDRADFGFYGMEYVARGQGQLTMAGIEHKLLPGSIFAYKPLTEHCIVTNRDDPLVKYFIDFSGVDAQRIIGRKVLGAQGVAYLHQVQPIHDLFDQLVETGLKGGGLAPSLCSLLLELLSLRIEENAHTPLEAHGRARQSFERCRSELQKNFRTIQSVSELAERTHMDPAYLARLFDRFIGESPHEMLTRLKVNEAAAHLIGGRFTVKEVAAQVGFLDPYHFSRVFKKHHGIPPARFQHARLRRSGRHCLEVREG
jgi:AraC-like DNA-binding protein